MVVFAILKINKLEGNCDMVIPYFLTYSLNKQLSAYEYEVFQIFLCIPFLNEPALKFQFLKTFF